ncbi:hypothetical protein DBR17_08520 [Sphingomonas sp. HMWF008]|nr:hypothetical protein DBR17_08520 [Sphingomonas sp. HMWF008]
MTPAACAFAQLTAAIEDLHSIAVNGQAPDLAADEGWALLASLRDGVQRLSRLMVDAASALT